MKLEDIVNINKIEDNVSDRKKVVANIQVRGNWFFSLFKQALKPYDLSEVQYNVLRILNGKHPEPLSSGEISNSLISQASDVTRIVDRLIQKGLVAREIPEGNRRLVLISLTKDGLNKLKETKDVLNQVFQKTNVWTKDEVKTLNTLLDKLE
jgi:DNA-binding MarR family transcriptional regulator